MKNMFILLIVFSSCGIQQEIIAPEAAESSLTKTVVAKVIYEPYENKAGKRIEGVGDYFLVYDSTEWFIKFTSGSVLRADVEKLNGKTAKFRVIEHEGLWDTDDPNVQSRVGKYVSIYEIIPE